MASPCDAQTAPRQACSTNYPSTPYLTETGNAGDTIGGLADVVMSSDGGDVVVTEKLDGGNCCIWDGQVYARTHAAPTRKPWFSPVKAMVPEVARRLRSEVGENRARDLQLFGENMTAVHGIEYGALASHIYIFAVRRASTGAWLPWDDVEEISSACGLPVVPVLFRGRAADPATLSRLMKDATRRPSALCTASPPEGFVVRPAGGFHDREFARRVAKYVREGFSQAADGSVSCKSWRKAHVVPAAEHCQTTHQPSSGDASEGAEPGEHAAHAVAMPFLDKQGALPPLPRHGAPRSALIQQVQGPTDGSNWVIPGMVMAGNRAAVDNSLEQLIAQGVTTFVSLQQKGDSPGGCYRRRVASALPEARFRSFPIPDQSVAEDSRVLDLVQELADRVLQNGEVLYIHCTGGHGRTGTICSLLLASAYSLAADEALGRVQAYHDTRRRPVFSAPRGVDGGPGCEPLWNLPQPDACVALFPVQRQQVQRLLCRIGRRDCGADAPEGLPSAPSLCEWRVLGHQAMEAASRREWEAAARLFRRCIDLRPSFPKSYTLLARCLVKLGRHAAAAEVCARGLDVCRDQAGAAGSRQLHQLKSLAGTLPASPPPQANESPELTSADRGGHPKPPQPPQPPPAAAAEAPRPDFLMLVGPPGAGKSTFAEALRRSSPDEWMLVSSDAVGSRSALEEALSHAMQEQMRCDHHGCSSRSGRRRVILDRCNVTSEERRRMLATAFSPRNAVAVYFHQESEEACVARVQARTDHPSIAFGHGRLAVRSMFQALTPPDTAEGFFKVVTVRTFDEAAQLLQSWGAAAPSVPPPGFFKFPRTRHVIDTGGPSVTRDDLVMDAGEAAKFWEPGVTVLAEEKVDGANLGLSLTRSYEIRVQNRSHWVNPESHSQFRSLGLWLDEHQAALCRILEPEVEILFGEWLYAVHSLEYDRLPGYFLAFDIYNKREGRFCSAEARNMRLEGSGIPVVRAVARKEFESASEVLGLVENVSAYRAVGHLEGVYLRIDSEDWNVERGKVVRSDFKQGITDGGGKHWSSRGVIQRNRLLHSWLTAVKEDEADVSGGR